MAKYYVNEDTSANPEGNNEIHTEDCYLFPDIEDTCVFLCETDDCSEAVEDAKQRGYIKADGCMHCCKSCHTG
ncbi:MAG: hypothetical protein PVI21_00355 [Candidatus Woesebacteria bacterium]|jgi:hypothetical protein